VPCESIHPPWRFSCFVALQPVILNGFLFGFLVMDIHKIVKIDEMKKKNLFHKINVKGVRVCIHPLCYEATK
jgi:hypothetical protein